MSSFVEISVDGPIRTLTINRPDKLNALSEEVLASLQDSVTRMSNEQGIRAAIITGAGKAFVAGADIAAMRDMSEWQGRDFGAAGHRLFNFIEKLSFPVIAAVNGFALGGGCELALACDFIYASTKAKFGQPEVGLGIIPGFGGTQRLPRRVGAAMARELTYTGKIIDAEEALRIGLANALFAPDELLAAAQATAAEIAAKGPFAVTAVKRLIAQSSEKPLLEGISAENDAFASCFGTDDQTEGMTAFLEKRAPEFTGK